MGLPEMVTISYFYCNHDEDYYYFKSCKSLRIDLRSDKYFFIYGGPVVVPDEDTADGSL